MLGVVFGLLFGAVGILIAEQVDDRISTPRHAETALQLDVLAAIPELESQGNRDRPLAPPDDPGSSPLEPFRRLRTEVVMRLQDAPGPKIVAVISAHDGEGRSTVAVNLARVLALEGHRVLLVDADLRRPRLVAMFAEGDGPGLEEYLLGEAPLAGSIQPSRLPGVHVLGARAEIHGPAEAPGSPRFRALWPAARAEFDFIVVDTSPVHAASEVPIVARSADASLLVVEEGRTGARQTLGAKRRLENHQVRVLGLVVNRSRGRLPSNRGSSGPGPVRSKAAPGKRPLVGIS
jgi:capsular exopolysaccharide synthesis family protein